MPTTIKQCGCGATFTAASWAELPPAVGGAHQFIEADEFGPATLLEYRNCRCNSTLVIELDPAGNLAILLAARGF